MERSNGRARVQPDRILRPLSMVTLLHTRLQEGYWIETYNPETQDLVLRRQLQELVYAEVPPMVVVFLEEALKAFGQSSIHWIGDRGENTRQRKRVSE